MQLCSHCASLPSPERWNHVTQALWLIQIDKSKDEKNKKNNLGFLVKRIFSEIFLIVSSCLTNQKLFPKSEQGGFLSGVSGN